MDVPEMEPMADENDPMMDKAMDEMMDMMMEE